MSRMGQSEKGSFHLPLMLITCDAMFLIGDSHRETRGGPISSQCLYFGALLDQDLVTFTRLSVMVAITLEVGVFSLINTRQ